MPTQAPETLLARSVLLTVLFFGLLIELGRLDPSPHPASARRPRTPDDCPQCRDAVASPPTATPRSIVPYAQRKSRRGPLREKTVDTHGQACPNPDCADLRVLYLTHIQLDELRIKVWGQAEAAWLWVAYDARTQALAHQLVHEVAQRLAPGCMPVFSSDGLALYFYALTAHFGAWVQKAEERRRIWTVDLRLLYAQVIKKYRRKRIAEVHHRVHLGTPETYQEAVRAAGFTGRIQTSFIERLNLTIRRSIAGLARRSWSAAHSLTDLALQFEWWRARFAYHFARPHAALRQLIEGPTSPPGRPRYTCPTAGAGRQRTPAQAAGVTRYRWTVLTLLAYPAPPVPVGQ